MNKSFTKIISESLMLPEDALVYEISRQMADQFTDQYLLETEPDEAGATIEHLDTAIPVQVNLAISGMERLVREVRAAVQRREREELTARRAAIEKLHCELSGTVTALLLSTELAMGTPELPTAAAEKLDSVYELVQQLRKQLETTGGL